jgi:Ca-activated chloride channel family protein
MSSLACELKGIRGERVALTGVSVSAVLQDLLAEVTMRQCYRNEEMVNIEAIYTFPLPLDAVLLEVEVEIGGRVLKGVVVEKKAAEEKYEDAIAAGDAAVMLEQLEPGLFTMNVGNLLPNESVTITFKYALMYRWAGERLRLFLPTTIASRYGNSPHAPHQAPESSLTVENRFSLRMEVLGSLREAQFTCPSHAVTLTRLEDKVVISLSQEQAAMDRDFVLNVQSPKASRSFALCGSDGDGLAAVANFQPLFPGLKQPRPLNLAILIDCSGSMQGDSIAQARKALEDILGALRPSDQVALIAFGSTTRTLWGHLTPCTPANSEHARHFARQLDASMGGTEIGTALQTTYRVLGENAGADILLVTDGEVSSWQSVVQEAKRSGHRIFTVGVGNAVSEAFVRELAAVTGGECELVAPREDMAERIVRHFERMRAPRARRVLVHWPEGGRDFAPAKQGVVFDGDTVIASARFDRQAIGGSVVLEIETETGETLRQELTVATVQPSETQDNISSIARFAASLRLKELEPIAGLRTALRYRLISSWTNWLVVAARSEESKAQGIPALRKIPQTWAADTVSISSCLAAPMPSPSISPAAEVIRGKSVFSRIAAWTQNEIASSPNSPAPQGNGGSFSSNDLQKAGELVRAVPAQEWLEIAKWASMQGHTDFARELSEFANLALAEMRNRFTDEQVRRGVEILRKAHHLGFKLSHGVLVESRRLGIDLNEAIVL